MERSPTYLPPQDKKDVTVRGYVTIHLAAVDSYVPRGACPWARRVLKKGANVVNKNELARWRELDPVFAEHLAKDRILVGDDFHPLVEVVAHNEGRKSAREQALEDRLAALETMLLDMSTRPAAVKAVKQ